MDGRAIDPITETVIEDFEAASPLTNYSQDTSAYGISTTTVLHGSKSLEVTTTGSYQKIHGGANNSPVQGDKFLLLMQLAENAGSGTACQVGFRFAHNGTATTSTDDSYWIWFLTDSDTLGLRKGDFSSQTVIANDTAATAGTYQAGSLLRLLVTWDDGSTFGGNAGDFTITMYDESGDQVGSPLTGNDTDHDGSTQTDIGWVMFKDNATTGFVGADYVHTVAV